MAKISKNQAEDILAYDRCLWLAHGTPSIKMMATSPIAHQKDIYKTTDSKELVRPMTW